MKGASGALTGQKFELGEITRIGSDAAMDVTIEGLAGEHARILVRDGALMLEPVGECVVNGEVAGPVALQSGDELRFGTVRMVLQAPGLKPARVLDQVPEKRSGRWRWALAGIILTGAAAAAGWWWLTRGTLE
ncbi:MAG: FHA domain-containing protein [Wenzhouxiangellaceae bacterium]